MKLVAATLLLLAAAPASAAPPAAVTSDPAPDAAHPAAMVAFQLPSHGALLNAVLYRAGGAGAHPTLLLLHGFPGNEQNLDLAQAVRRAGWNVLTLHYRGSWRSPGTFSYAHCAEDAAAALAFLRSPDAVARLGIDPRRIVVGGHSMGGMMAARAAADDILENGGGAVIGTILIDAWDIAGTGRAFVDPKVKQGFLEAELRGDLPPLAGTSEAALVAEIEHAPPALDLIATVPALAGRPLLVFGAERGIAATAKAVAATAKTAGASALTTKIMPTDHSFSDMRIALESKVVAWLKSLHD